MGKTPAEHAAYMREWRKAHPSKNKEYYLKNHTKNLTRERLKYASLSPEQRAELAAKKKARQSSPEGLAKQRAAQQRYRENHPNLQRNKQIIRRDLLAMIKTQHGCKQCGAIPDSQNPPSKFHFHHRDPDSKFMDVSRMWQYSVERIMEEIAKCDVLCFECHEKVSKEMGQRPGRNGL